MIFDEATSSLDAESERIVQNAINNSLENKTAIIVAHRLSTIINCDLIVVFEKGQIVEQGKHSELMDMNGYYANLYNLQFKHDKS
ncbi:Toxin RTX-I translocation ATP-binding protein [bioreactor metagenome]|uniref:Toxin RTX-I translocation ATP-binding protein n=1 Tax=bioreactor metagenome TaxID=1076179 RepID=A0A645H3G5_9ZZZZ